MDVLKSWEIDYVFLEILYPPIARGAMGVVNKAKYNGTLVAVKTFFCGASTGVTLAEFRREVKNLCTLHHPNIVLFIGFTADPPTIVEEFAERGSLFDVISSGVPLSWERKIQIAIDAAQGMLYLHKQNPPILHRDLKSGNILLFNDWRAKICDFGSARNTNTMSQRVMTKMGVGTTRWCAPELLANTGDYTEKVDVFSFGVILWELLTNQIPFSEYEWEAELVEKIVGGLRLSVPEGCPERYEALLRGCIVTDPSQRLSFDIILHELNEIKPSDFENFHINPMGDFVEQVQLIEVDSMAGYKPAGEEERRKRDVELELEEELF